MSGQGAPDPREAADGLSEQLGRIADNLDSLSWSLNSSLLDQYVGELRTLARQRPTAPPEDRVTAAMEALAAEFQAEKERAARWAAETTDSFREAMSRKVAWEEAERRLRAAIAAAREDNGGAGDA